MQTPPVLGYMMWKADGTPYSPRGGWEMSRRGLLIGDDLMPLRGLAETEAHMAARGVRCSPTFVEEATEDGHFCYAATIAGVLSPDMITWPVCAHTAFSFGKLNRPVPVVLEREDAALCDRFFSMQMRLHPDGRRKTTLARARAQVEAIFTRAEIVPIRFRIPAAPCEVGTEKGNRDA